MRSGNEQHLNDLTAIVLHQLGALAICGCARGIKSLFVPAIECTACILLVAASRLVTRRSATRAMVIPLPMPRLLLAARRAFGIILGVDRNVGLPALMAARLLVRARAHA